MYTGLPRRFAPRNDVHALDCFATLAMTEKDGLPRPKGLVMMMVKRLPHQVRQ